MIEQKDMTFDHDVCYSFPLFSSFLKKGGEKRNEEAKIVIKSHDFLLDQKNVEYTFKCGFTSFIIIIKFLTLRKYTNIDVDKNVFFCLFVKYLLINHQSINKHTYEK